MSTVMSFPQAQPFMYLDDPPKPHRHPWELPDEDTIKGFAVPYQLRFLLPCIDTVHILTLDLLDLLAFQRHCLYQHFRILPDSQREDYSSDIIYMDDEENDTYIRQLQQEDILKNENYAKLFTYITIFPLPFFLIRFWVRPSLLDLICIISLMISTLSIPAPYTGTFGLVPIAPWWVSVMRVNMYTAFAIALHVTFFPPGEYTWRLQGSEEFWMSDVSYLGLMPSVIAVYSHVARRMMEAVNYLDMGVVRYLYLEPKRWEFVGAGGADLEMEVTNVMSF